MRNKNRRKHIRSCQRKRKYSKHVARAVARRMNRAGNYVNAYRCPICEGWHVGKPFGRTRIEMAFKRLERQYNHA